MGTAARPASLKVLPELFQAQPRGLPRAWSAASVDYSLAARSGDDLLPSGFEMVGNEGEDGVVAGGRVRLIAGDEDGEVFLWRDPRNGEPHRVAAGVGEGGPT